MPPYSKLHPSSSSSSSKLYLHFKNSNLLTLTLISLLCSLSFLLGLYNHHHRGFVSSPSSCPTTTTTTTTTTLDFEAHHTLTTSTPTSNFPPCISNLSEYTPCEDRDRSLKFARERLIYRERHCPAKRELLKCLVPAPFGYRNPFRWPQSRELAWFNNVPHKELTVEKAVQNWIRVEGDRFRFPGGGTMFPNGADAYIEEIGKLIDLKSGGIRTAIDTGCGVSLSFSSGLVRFYSF